MVFLVRRGGFRVSGFRFRVSRFWFGVSGFGFQFRELDRIWEWRRIVKNCLFIFVARF